MLAVSAAGIGADGLIGIVGRVPAGAMSLPEAEFLGDDHV